MNISIIGAGYVGLVTAVCLSEFGHRVLCIEKDPNKLSMLKQNKSTIYEPGLETLLTKHRQSGTLSFSDNIEKALNHSPVIFICVGTPQNKDGEVDLSQIAVVSTEIGRSKLNQFTLIIEKSTVPVNTHKKIQHIMSRYHSDQEMFDVASNPEFLREGQAIQDFMNPDRVILGVNSEKARALLEEIYAPLIEQKTPFIFTSLATSELIKHAANSFLALKISYINKMAEICEKVGADVSVLAKGIGMDPRIGSQFLNPGIGYGGSCLPKDVSGFIHIGKELGINMTLFEETAQINHDTKDRFIKKLDQILWTQNKKKVAIWGLAFKANTDDIREAPSLKIVETLLQNGAIVAAHDPKAMDNFKKAIGDSNQITYHSDPYECLDNSDILLILTDWDSFSSIQADTLKSKMSLPIILDGRNLIDPKMMQNQGIEYHDMGRTHVQTPALALQIG